MERQMTFAETNPEYEAFVDKFKPKLTTDDCYTPDIVYNAIRDYAVEKYHLQGAEIVRPFYPGRDYQMEEYPEGSVVLDNPPFSIITQIVKWYIDRNIKFFLFAPSLTLFSTGSGRKDITRIGVHAPITYENGAVVNTSFLTNLSPGILAESDPLLNSVVKKANKENVKKEKKELPKYVYPDEVLTSTMINYMSEHGVTYKVMADDAYFVRSLDSQRKKGKAIFGDGFLLSEKAAAEKAAAEKTASEKAASEKAAAEKAASEKATSEKWELSERERKIIDSLG